MKRVLLVLLAIVMTIGGSSAAKPKKYKLAPEAPKRYFWNDGHASYYQQYPIYGDVESMTIHFKRSFEDDVIVEETTVAQFNERGDVKSLTTTDVKGDTCLLILIEYNEHGDTTKERIYDYGELRRTNEYTYNDDRSMVRKKSCDGDGYVRYDNKYEYESESRKIMEPGSPYETILRESDSGEIMSYVEHEDYLYASDRIVIYNEQGLKLRDYWICRGKITEDSYVYDKAGREIEHTIWTNSIEYYIAENIHKYLDMEPGYCGIAEHYIIKRDKRGNVVKVIAEPDESGFCSVTTYDITYRK